MISNDYIINIDIGEYLNKIKYFINLLLNISYIIRVSYYRNLKKFLALINYNYNYILII